MVDRDAIERCGRLLREAGRVMATTGAGISAESGVPTFRGPDGLWRRYRPEDLATPEAFGANPALVWEWYRWRRARIAEARPNPGHDALSRFERRWPAFELVTQNVDGLHHRAGSTRVIEVHGNIWRTRCARRCGFSIDESPGAATEPVPLDDRGLPVCQCGGMLRPDVTWFGEALDAQAITRAFALAESCEVLLVVGTSSLVYPAAAVPEIALGAGATVIEINVDATPLTSRADVSLRGLAGEILPALEGAV
ncbi:MAG: NAD-dependent deacylase [Acidobacteriota bacterium]